MVIGRRIAAILLGDRAPTAHLPLKKHASTLVILKMRRDHYPHDLAGGVIGPSKP
jgi:hypothetical protein